MNIKDLDETLTQSKCPTDISYCNCGHHKHGNQRPTWLFWILCVVSPQQQASSRFVLSISLFFSFVPSFLFSLVLLRYNSHSLKFTLEVASIVRFSTTHMTQSSLLSNFRTTVSPPIRNSLPFSRASPSIVSHLQS